MSPILLVLAALCFLLPFVSVSCNTAAGGSAAGTVLPQLGAAAPSSGALTSCLRALQGRDLVSYSGAQLVTGGSPSTTTSIPGCASQGQAPPSSGIALGIGVQPLLVAALVLIVVGIAAALLRGAARPLLAAAAALLAALVIIVDNVTVHGAILDRISAEGGGSLSGLGVTAGIGTFFNVHAAIGFLLVLVALFAALAVNAAALLSWSREQSQPPLFPPPAAQQGPRTIGSG